MKKKLIFCLLIAVSSLIISCSDSGNGKKFQPKEKKETMSDDERREAIDNARKYANMIEDMLKMHGVKISVVQPSPVGDITSVHTAQIAARLVNICSQNGISAIGNDPIFVLGAEIIPGEKASTGTAPQKMTVQYEIIYSVGNAATGDIFASCTQTITGAGKSYEAATRNALKQIKPTPRLAKMLADASDRIIKWYDENLSTLQSQVATAAGKGNYALALALLSSVPQQCTAAFGYAQSERPSIFEKWKEKTASDNLAAMQAAISATDDEFNPTVAGYFALIPAGTAQYAKAEAIFAQYRKDCQAKIERKIAQEREDTAAVRAYRLQLRQLEVNKELAAIEADKLVAIAEAEASANASSQDTSSDESQKKRRGFWSKIGDRIVSGIDALSGYEDEEDDDD